MQALLQHAFLWTPIFPMTPGRFSEFLEKGRRALPELVYQYGEYTRQILVLAEALNSSTKRYKGMDADLVRLVPKDWPTRTPFANLQHLPRYLKAMQVRAERAVLSPAKDTDKAVQLAPFHQWEKKVPSHNHNQFRWLLEEFRVSLFAQELGTAQSVSATKLKSYFE